MVTGLDLNIRHLSAAVAIARVGSISGTAEVIHITQPALTNALRKLEAQLANRLFERRSNGAEPTAAGRLFLAHAQDGVAKLAAAVQHLRQANNLRPAASPERHVSNIQLRAFLAVLRAGNYTAAAKELGLSQPSVYRAVRDLQLFLGVPLFVQDGVLMRARENVQQFANGVRLALANIQAGIDELMFLDESSPGRISVGSLPLARSMLLPRILAPFSAPFSKISVSVSEGVYSELIARLRNGSIDMLFGALRSNFTFSDLKQQMLFNDRLFVVGRAGHPLANTAALPEQLAAFPWIMGAENSPGRKVWEQYFLKAGIALPNQCVECGSILLARGLMLEGNWLGLMSPHQSKIDEESGVLTRIGPAVPGSIRPIGLTTRVDWRPTSVQMSFLEKTIEVSAKLSS